MVSKQRTVAGLCDLGMYYCMGMEATLPICYRKKKKQVYPTVFLRISLYLLYLLLSLCVAYQTETQTNQIIFLYGIKKQVQEKVIAVHIKHSDGNSRSTHMLEWMIVDVNLI